MISLMGEFKSETFMFRIIHAITMLAVLVHMLVGCCLHHAHAEETATCSEASHGDLNCCHEQEVVEDRHFASQFCQKDCIDSRDCCFVNGHQHGHRQCNEDDCVFIAEDPPAELAFSLAGIFPVFSLADVEPSGFKLVQRSDREQPRQNALFLSVRPHLAHAVFLL